MGPEFVEMGEEREKKKKKMKVHGAKGVKRDLMMMSLCFAIREAELGIQSGREVTRSVWKNESRIRT